MRHGPRLILLAAAVAQSACAYHSANQEAAVPSPSQGFAASCVVAQARQEGFTTQRDTGRYTWVLARAYSGGEGVAREETIYLEPLHPAHSDTVRIHTASGATASPYLNASNFAPALDRVMRRVSEHCTPAETAQAAPIG